MGVLAAEVTITDNQRAGYVANGTAVTFTQVSTQFRSSNVCRSRSMLVSA
jgi:hypothetical protein